MGRATVSKDAQIEYLENRMKLLCHVVESLKREGADKTDLENILKMLKDLTMKVERFHEDWAKQ